MYTLNFYIVFFFMGCRNSGWNIKRRIRMINCQENIWTENLTSILKHVFRNNNSGCISLRRIDICIKRPYKGILNLFCLYTWDICLCSSLFSLFLCRYFSEDMALIHSCHWSLSIFLWIRLVFWCFQRVLKEISDMN